MLQPRRWIDSNFPSLDRWPVDGSIKNKVRLPRNLLWEHCSGTGSISQKGNVIFLHV